MEQLSEHDRDVLNTMFDPFHLMSSGSNVEETQNEIYDTIDDFELNESLKRAIVTAESGNLHEALQLFDEIFLKSPNHPIVLNNRAQALRLTGRVDEALNNLNKAVIITGGKGKAGTKALCQRGLLHRLAGREDEAKRDFEIAAKQGSVFARTQLVNLNPYAAMCNAMLREINSKSEFHKDI